MLNFKFDWDPRLELNIPHLDEHHQHFFKLGRHIEQLLLIQCAGVTNKDLFNLLYELRDYVTYHFYEEEKIMEEINFPELHEHRLEHQKFLAYINRIDYDKLCANPYDELKKLKDDMTAWSFTHIVQQDQKLIPYYNATLACSK
ncbi:MAG: hemerythrin domain-containing protein [Cellulosilyticum sp.]|nr:hemerythrin domain-containing protein [Cellulosilyticum sp.]